MDLRETSLTWNQLTIDNPWLQETFSDTFNRKLVGNIDVNDSASITNSLIQAGSIIRKIEQSLRGLPRIKQFDDYFTILEKMHIETQDVFEQLTTIPPDSLNLDTTAINKATRYWNVIAKETNYIAYYLLIHTNAYAELKAAERNDTDIYKLLFAFVWIATYEIRTATGAINVYAELLRQRYNWTISYNYGEISELMNDYGKILGKLTRPY